MPFKHNASRRHRIGKMKFKVTNWAEYEAGLRRRGSLMLWMTPEALSSWQAPKRTTRGGQPRYSDLAIETALTLGLLFGLRLRQTEGLLTSVLTLMGLDLAVPDHTTLSRRASKRRLPDRRRKHQAPGKGHVHVLIDSTGLEIYGAGQWLEEKHGAKSRRNWRKLHLALDAGSGDIIAHVMTDQDAGDASQVEALLDQIDPPVGQFTADGAYDGSSTYDAVAWHSAGATAVIPPRANAVKRPDADPEPTRPPNRGDQHRWPDEVAGCDRLRETISGRDRNRSLQIDHRTQVAGAFIRSAADGSRHRLCRPQSNAGMRTPEIRPLQNRHRVARASKTEIRSFSDRCTNAAEEENAEAKPREEEPEKEQDVGRAGIRIDLSRIGGQP